MADYLTRKFGRRKYGVFKSIVKASRSATERELSMENELEMSRVAQEDIYTGRSNDSIIVQAPKEILLHPRRMMASELARGVSLFEIKPEYREEIANRILEIEMENLFPNGDTDLSHFDPDRHAGNYRIYAHEVENGKPTLEIRPIDFGQVQSISRFQRRQIIRLFSLSQVLKKTGSTDWAAREILKTLDYSKIKFSKMKRTLRKYFPHPNAQPVSAYYATLAAFDDLGIEISTVFYDYVRGIVQLNQYEQFASTEAVQTPKRRLIATVKEEANTLVKRMKLSTTEKLAIAKRGVSETAASTCKTLMLRYAYATVRK